MNFVRGTLAALALSAPVSAMAADLPRALPVKAPIMAPVVWNWSGFYIGGNVGYSWGRNPYDLAGSSTVRTRTFRGFTTPTPTLLTDVTTAGPAFAGSGTANIDGAVAGGQVGYNWQTGMWVFGLETDLQWTGQRGATSFCLTVGCPVGGFVANADYKLSWFGTFRARAGWLIDPRVLLYVTGGLAYGEIKADYTAGVLGLPLGGVSTKTTRAGWTVGGGIEGALTNNWTVKLEYLYVDLGSLSSGALAGATSSVSIDPQTTIATVVDTTFAANATTRLRDNIVRIGINYHFTPDAVVAKY